MCFQHVIITRFNVNIHSVEYAFRLSETYLLERFDIFNKFCFPSIRRQESQEFTWLVLFDVKTPERFKRMIGSYEQYNNFVPIFCNDYSTTLDQVKEYIMRAYPDAEYYLTTRLDNDDALSKIFVKTLHGAASDMLHMVNANSPELFINFTNGVQYCSGSVYKFSDITNCFVSLLEHNKPPHTALWVDHPGIYSKAPVAQIETRPIFLQNIHSSNVYNYIRGAIAEDKYILDEFSLDL